MKKQHCVDDVDLHNALVWHDGVVREPGFKIRTDDVSTDLNQ